MFFLLMTKRKRGFDFNIVSANALQFFEKKFFKNVGSCHNSYFSHFGSWSAINKLRKIERATALLPRTDTQRSDNSREIYFRASVLNAATV